MLPVGVQKGGEKNTTTEMKNMTKKGDLWHSQTEQ